MFHRHADPLESALLNELSLTWHRINATHFDDQLRSPVIQVHEGRERMGSWDARTRTLSLSRPLLMEESWLAVLEVLKHELAHQFVDEVLRIQAEPAHGPTFQRVCERFGVDPRATGSMSKGPTAGNAEREPRALRRIRRLLALADSPNEHEAQAAMNAAHRLMLKYNLDPADTAHGRRYVVRQLTPVKGRFQAHEKHLAALLVAHFFVNGIWVTAYDPKRRVRGRVLEVNGTSENVEIASWVHAYLLETGERLWKEHKRRRDIRGNRDRRRYLAGIMTGFDEKLKRQNERCAREEGLVWLGDPQLLRFHQRRHPHARRTRASTMQLGEAWYHGRSDGQDIVLRRPLHDRKSGRGRLLEG